MRLPPETEARREKDGAQRTARKGRRTKDGGKKTAGKGRRAKGNFGRIGAFARKKAIWEAKIVDKTRKKR